jgi:alkylation response protein AidB-like acyl-CoA dehydrogenase
MDFELNEEQQAIFDMARDFGAEKIAPFAAQWEKEEAIPRAVLEEAAALGLAAIYVPEEDGGSGLTRLDATLVFEALSMACPSVASFLSIHNMCTWDDRFLWLGRDEVAAAARPRHHDQDRLLLPDRTRLGIGCLGSEDPRRTDQ